MDNAEGILASLKLAAAGRSRVVSEQIHGAQHSPPHRHIKTTQILFSGAAEANGVPWKCF